MQRPIFISLKMVIFSIINRASFNHKANKRSFEENEDSVEKAKAMLVVTLLLVTFLVSSEAGREMMKPKEEVYNPNWLLGWGHFWPWWWWGLHPWLGALDHGGLKDAPYGYGAKGELPYSHDKGSSNGNGNGNGGGADGQKGGIPDHGGDGHNGDGGGYP